MQFRSQWLNKPEYWFRPQQILKRLIYRLSPPRAGLEAVIKLPWGLMITAGAHETIGKSLCTLGVYELAVSETIWRLTDPGDECVDAGANIGYMTSIMALRSGSAGLVKSFEPHPKVFAKLQRNVGDWSKSRVASCLAGIEPSPLALGAGHASMRLSEPDGFTSNEGTASLTAKGSGGYDVQVERLDRLAASSSGYGILKVDVEGAELEVFEGAENLFAAKKIRDVIYEDFSPFPSRCAELLKQHGYTIFRLTKQLRGPHISDPTDQRAASSALAWEPVNYLATIRPARVQELMSVLGWQCLRG